MASLTFSLFHFHNQPAALGLRQLGLSVCRRWRSLASRYGFWGRRLWHRTCKTSRGWLEHRTCKTSPGWLPGAKALAQNVQDQPRMATGGEGFGTERARLAQGGFRVVKISTKQNLYFRPQHLSLKYFNSNGGSWELGVGGCGRLGG